jgi:HK97 gp10 family phage protein|tara:strand:- start:6642 stop:7103 length:462 start_codon:yes stop_codon:yes gene_type:complete
MELNVRKVLGMRELQKALKQIPYEVKRNKLMMAVFRQAAKPIIAQARANINNDEGDLKRSIKAFSTRASRRLPALYVGPKATGGSAKKNNQRGGGFYGAMVEYGTAHAAPHPFMRPAWEMKQNAAGAILLEGARKVVEKVLQRETKGLKRLYR